jgi:hypothetical protein
MADQPTTFTTIDLGTFETKASETIAKLIPTKLTQDQATALIQAHWITLAFAYVRWTQDVDLAWHKRFEYFHSRVRGLERGAPEAERLLSDWPTYLRTVISSNWDGISQGVHCFAAAALYDNDAFRELFTAAPTIGTQFIQAYGEEGFTYRAEAIDWLASAIEESWYALWYMLEPQFTQQELRYDVAAQFGLPQ